MQRWWIFIQESGSSMERQLNLLKTSNWKCIIAQAFDDKIFLEEPLMIATAAWYLHSTKPFATAS